jgi:hypothetical protein
VDRFAPKIVEAIHSSRLTTSIHDLKQERSASAATAEIIKEGPAECLGLTFAGVPIYDLGQGLRKSEHENQL